MTEPAAAPPEVLIVPGLTLPEVSPADLTRIRAAGGGAQVVVSSPRDALAHGQP